MHSIQNHLARGLIAALLVIAPGFALRAQTTTFTDRGSFTASASGLTTESFDTLASYYSTTIGLAGPWDSNSLGAAPGLLPGVQALVPGLQISAGGGGPADVDTLIFGRSVDQSVTFGTPGVAADGFVASNQNLIGSSLIFSFTGGATTAVGFDYFNPGTDGSLVSTIRVYDMSDALLSTNSYTPTAAGGFFGVTSSVAIGRVSIQNFGYTGSGFENVEAADNISFGAAAVPEPSTWAAIAGAAMLGFALWRRRGGGHPLAGGLLFALTGLLASAQTQVSNLDNQLGGGTEVSGNLKLATSFTTDNQSYTLNSITVRALSGESVLTLLPDAGGAPSNSTGPQFQYPDGYTNPYSGGMFVFGAPASTVLAANTTYWVVVGGGDFSNPPVYHGGFAITFDHSQEGSWTIGDTGLFGTDGDWDLTGVLQFSVDATPIASAVPEPSTYASIAGAMALGLAMARRVNLGGG